MNQNALVVDHFSNPDSQRLYDEQWPDELEIRDLYYRAQCGGCTFYAPFNSDWGLCCNASSRHHLETVSEHFTCPANVNEGWGPHSFTENEAYHCTCGGSSPARHWDTISKEAIAQQMVTFRRYLDIFGTLLRDAGYTTAYDSKGRYIQGMVQLMLGLRHMTFLREPYVVQLMSHAQVRKGTAYTYKQLVQLANPQANIGEFQGYMQELAHRGVIIRGYEIQCALCDITNWYTLPELSEDPVCKGCHSPLRVPMDLDFYYQLNQLYSAGMKSGALSVLLTALRLNDLCSGEVEWLSGLIAHKNGIATDIDLFVRCGTTLFVAECKDNFNEDEASITALCNQLERGLQVARELKTQFIFSTLRPEGVPQAITDYLRENAGNTTYHIIDRDNLLRSSSEDDVH